MQLIFLYTNSIFCNCLIFLTNFNSFCLCLSFSLRVLFFVESLGFYTSEIINLQIEIIVFLFSSSSYFHFSFLIREDFQYHTHRRDERGADLPYSYLTGKAFQFSSCTPCKLAPFHIWPL